jgi:hypothetical protein
MCTLLVPTLLHVPPAGAGQPGIRADESPYMDSVSAALPGPQWMRSDYERGFANDEWAGIRWAYVWVDWSDIEKVPGLYDFSGLDDLVVSAHSHGIDLMMQVQTGGDFVVPGPAQLAATGGYRTNARHPVLPSSAPRNLEGPIGFWRAIARHYMPNGQLAHAEHWTDDYGVRYFEVENEPDSLPWITGTWSNVPKDYALYVSVVRRTLRSVWPDLKVVGPALGTGPDGSGCCSGLSWLDQVLRVDGDLQWASDQYRTAVAGGQPIVGGGPLIDVYSFHDDFYDPSSSYSIDRTRGVRDVVRRYSRQVRYPAPSGPVLWETEGGPVTRPGDQVTYARDQAQVTIRLINAGVQRVNFDASGLRGDSPSTRDTDPAALEARALATYFPSYRGIVSRTSQITLAAHNAVEAYSWTDRRTHLRSWILWAPNGSGAAFTVPVPVRTPFALLLAHDWASSQVRSVRGTVAVDVQPGTPSEVVMVVERP